MNLKHPKKILELSEEEINKCIHSGDIVITVIGIGRIGLPTALSFAYSGFPTIGVDINKNLVQMINSGNFPLKDEPEFDKIFDNVIKSGKFEATTEISQAVPKSNFIILSLPTPMDKNNVPDYSALISVGVSLNKLLIPGSIVVVESTIEPGFVENELIPIIEGSDHRLKVGQDFIAASCS